ncbi:MAG: hypothetical protein GY696_01835, partial [Gammaproteobacteria bacterium]|nr:hypothetical protein [Gammaproteobacteria bacterium]
HRRSVYMSVRRRYEKALAQAKKAYILDKFDVPPNSGAYWRAVNETFRGMGTREIPPLLLADGSFAVEAVDKANALADQFDSVWNPLAPNSTLELPMDCPVDFEFLADVDDIRDLLKELNPKKSPGPDLLPSLPLLKNSDILAPSLALLINRGVRETRCPSEWKQAFVSPIPKVVGSAECGDYRPISLLPIVSKICEKFL